MFIPLSLSEQTLNAACKKDNNKTKNKTIKLLAAAAV